MTGNDPINAYEVEEKELTKLYCVNCHKPFAVIPTCVHACPYCLYNYSHIKAMEIRKV